MKKLKNILGILILTLVMAGMSSCLVRVHEDQGRHRGWFKHHDNRGYRERERQNVYIITSDKHDNHSKSKHFKGKKEKKR